MPEKNNSVLFGFEVKSLLGILSKIITHPLTLILSRKRALRYPFTASNGKTYSGTILGITQQLADEGFLNMRGLIVNCLSVIPVQAILNPLRDPVKSFFKNVFIIEKDSSFFKRFLYILLSGSTMGALSITMFYGLHRYLAVSGLPPECVTEPSTIYELYSGYGLSVSCMMLSRGLYVGMYDMMKPFVKGLRLGFWGKFALGYSVTTLTGLIVYPLRKIQLMQMVHCCTASKAIAIIHDHPAGLWEGYMAGWEYNIAGGLGGIMVRVACDYYLKA